MKLNIKIIFAVVFLLIIIISVYLILANNKIRPQFTQIDLSKIEGQMEYVNINNDETTTFLTYRETALAALNNNLGEYSVTSNQFIYGVIYDLTWTSDRSKAVISFANDPDELSNYSGYLEQNYINEEFVYGILDVNKQSVTILPAGSKKTWMSDGMVYGYSEGEVLSLNNERWKKTGIRGGNSTPIISSTGECFATLIDKTINVYSYNKVVYSVPINERDYSRFRLLDNGELVYIDKEIIEIHKSETEMYTTKMSSEDEVIVGQNTLFYKTGKKYYLYKTGFKKFKGISLGRLTEFDSLKSFGLNKTGMFYISDEDNYTLTLIRF